MPIHRNKKIAFAHIPKTGGTTVEKIFGLYVPWPELRMDVLRGPYDLGGEQVHLQHLPLNELSSVADINFAEWYKFAFVRNPWDRLVSAFCFKMRRKDHSDAAFPSYVSWVDTVVASRDKLTSDNCHLRPQVEYSLDDLDFVGRFENFERDLNNVLDTLGVSPEQIPHAHKSKRQHYSTYYNEETKQKVAEIYAEDIEALEYTFNG